MPTATCSSTNAGIAGGETQCELWVPGTGRRSWFEGWLESRAICPENRKKEQEESEEGTGKQSRMTGPSPCQWAPHATLRPGMESRPRLTMPANLAPSAPARLLRILESKMTIKYRQNVSLPIVTARTGTQWHDFRGSRATGGGVVLGQEALSKRNQGQ